MKILAALLIEILVCPAPLLAQERAPLLSQARAAITQDNVILPAKKTDLVIKKEMEHPVVFWTGAALLAIGVTALVSSATWSRDSDLSNEFQGVRIGRDLASCGTDPQTTTLPIADCKLNTGLAWIGGSLAVVGGGMMVIGGKQIETVQRRTLVRASIRF